MISSELSIEVGNSHPPGSDNELLHRLAWLVGSEGKADKVGSEEFPCHARES
jgi:hypothetical protein